MITRLQSIYGYIIPGQAIVKDNDASLNVNYYHL